MNCDCYWCKTQDEWRERWDEQTFGTIRRVLECHALGAEVIALKDPKYERLAALRALDALRKLQQDLVELRTEMNGDVRIDAGPHDPGPIGTVSLTDSQPDIEDEKVAPLLFLRRLWQEARR